MFRDWNLLHGFFLALLTKQLPKENGRPTLLHLDMLEADADTRSEAPRESQRGDNTRKFL